MQIFTLPFRSRLLNLLVLCSLVLLHACSSDDDPVTPVEENQHLIQSTVITELSKEQVLNEANGVSPLLGVYIKNGIKVYRITYKTKNTDGADVTASGALILPNTTQPASMISVQHGTIREDASAPSNFNDGSEAASFGALFGAMGYIIAYPDYIGYGASKDLPHTYEQREGLSTACLDMLRAAKEFLKDQSAVKWDEKLYIAGYSEGGYATMSLQKKIEEEAASEFNLRASSCGAGAYDKTAFMKYIVNETTDGIASSNSLYLWVLLTYDRIYKLNKPTSYYFKEPFATRIAQSGINVSINQSFDTILTDTFKKSLVDGTDKGFLDAIADNNVYNWKPNTPTRLYHGDADRTVFYFNSVNAYNAMKAKGAPDVQLVTVPNGTHASSITAFLIGTLTFFTSTK
ncbi:alpha/beta hydrolase family protein [Dyadobacter sandarakinus]|uniref:Prolyl oligopeptidase family serine peptidase n=1 Tax=Dyadobacter sandarakinus TaxID=2747268 RepID=A0ABX7IB66_9BACT|nr:prolyl oligopeptidase family serine peptidase [Dyadobacter sandarakinus]QRR03361.1 prolyl oligopeptidase family serine peptidase [Dyadobacter sandarakinus]